MRQVSLIPAIRIEEVGVESGVVGGVPDGGGVVDCVGRDGKDCALGKVVRTEGYARPGGNDAGKTEGGGGVDAESFGDDIAEAGDVGNQYWPCREIVGAEHQGKGGHTMASL